MTITIEALKEKARRQEQDEEWRAALDLYLRAIRRLEEEERPDIALYNRVGDLYARVGAAGEAVEHYETAVDLYEEAGLANNAIAVCKKIIRNVPGRHSVFLRMGMIRARQGFLVDARHHFLTYAERMKAAGDFDEAMRALVEFAELAPGDAEVRLAVAAQFEQHDRPEDAADQLARAYQALSVDEDARADEVGERLLALRPAADLAALAAAARPDAPLETTSFSTEDLDEPVGAGAEIEEPDMGGFEIALGGADAAEGPPSIVTGAPAGGDRALPVDREAGPAADRPEEPMDPADRSGGLAMVPGGEDEAGAPGPDLEDEAFEVGPPLPLMSFDDDDEPAVTGEGSAAPFEDADRLDVDVPERDTTRVEDEDVTPLPFLDGTIPPVEPSAAAPGLPDLEAADAWTEPEEPATPAEAGDDTWDEAVGEATEQALEERRSEERAEASPEADIEPPSWDEAEASVADLADAPSADDLGAPSGQGFEAPPADEVEACQRAVERAFRAGSEPELVAAYLALAQALEGSGAGERARGVYQQILGIEPAHEAARAALGRVVGAPEPAPEVASSEDYVDLGALILGDDAEKTTRFVVAYEEPSGDEDADFARMLSQFKAKVAENVDSSDVKAHHDLGVAYREMGLLDESIEQFQKALRAAGDHLATYEALGQAFLDKGAYAPAVRVLSRALDAPWEVEDELLGIYYYLGRAYEAQGNTAQAVEFYDRVFSLDINFADVTERLRVLR